MMRSLTVLYCPWARRNRLDTFRTSTAKSLISEFLGEVALKATEHGQRNDEQHEASGQNGAVESGVPEHALVRQHVVHGRHTVDGVVGGGHRIDATLEGQNQ